MKIKSLPTFFKILVLQIAAILVASFLLAEIYLHFNKGVLQSSPALLRERSIEYEPSVFARAVFPQKEQRTKDMYWVAKGKNPDRFINKHGYRGREFSIQKPPGTIRVIVYGGSSVFDLALTEDKDWPHRIEQYLHEDGLVNVEVINAGIPGHASHDAFGMFFPKGTILCRTM